jgi:branched-chain amino acid transport system permease protein
MSFLCRNDFITTLAVFALLPLTDQLLPPDARFASSFQPIFILALLGLGLNIISGYAGMLNLGVAGLMAIGAYTYAILTCDIYPFYMLPPLNYGSVFALLIALIVGAFVGLLLALPAIRLSGDYLAIVTLGFGEIVQSVIRNLDTITKGTQGINPLPPVSLFGVSVGSDSYLPQYYFLLAILTFVCLISKNVERSRFGQRWFAIRDDELAAKSLGIPTAKVKLLAFAAGAALCSLSGAVWAAYLGSSGEPGNYDFQLSVIALCIVIVGGLGSIRGVLLGAVVVGGFNSILLSKLSQYLSDVGIASGGNSILSPTNWKFMIFGLALILVMRVRPNGLFGVGAER